MFIVVLVILGLCAGSFVNALVWRLHQQTKKTKDHKLSILFGRSVCPNCDHTLAWYDLIPVFSWLLLKGRCRYCKKPISAQYPAVETGMAIVFVASYIFWPETISQNGQWLLFGTWLLSSVGLLALAVYDLRWMLLPNKIVYPTLFVAAAGRSAYILVYSDNKWHDIYLWAISLLIASGVFWLLFTISKGKWIGYGDVRLGLITGTLLADPYKALLMLFFASVLGSLTVLPGLVKRQKTLSSRLPYGPFLIMATGIVVLFGDSLINWYKGLLGL